jgi:hypothetical protein
MADHRAIWVRLRELAWERFPDDELAVEIAAREAFNVEESAAYAVDLDAQVEEHGVLETAHAATRLQRELREELRKEGLGAGGNEVDDDYVHLDDADDLDDDDLADLPDDAEAEEAATEQKMLMAAFET